MAPIPRCELRLPGSIAPTKRPWDAGQAHAQRSHTRDSAEILESASEFSTGVTRDMAEIREHELHEGGATVPVHAQRSHTRDSAEILEDASEFSTGVTRDMAEVREHKLHEGAAEETAPDACAVLAQCRAEVDAAAAAVNDEDIGGACTTLAPTVEVSATPGDVCAHFCEDRPESPSSGYDLRSVVAADKFGKHTKPVKQCKGTYAPVEAYAGLWGGQKAWVARKKLELEMRTKRKLYEGVHERNRRRREKERRRCMEKNRMMRCMDQAKITEEVDNIAVNKAFYLRFNYNKRLPFMPSDMNEHLRRFKKPPFKFFPKGSRPCRKEVDEFAKLRVEERAKTGTSVTTRTPTPKLKA